MAQKKLDKKEVAKTFLARVLEKVPEAQREQVSAALTQDEVLDLVGEGVLTKEEGSRLAQEAQEKLHKAQSWHDNLDDWHKKKSEENAALVLEVAALKAKTGGARDDDDPSPNPNPNPRPATVELPKDVVRSAALSQGLVEVSTLVTLGGRHQQEFGEPLDVGALLAHAGATGLRVSAGGYDSFVAERRATRQEEQRKKELAEAEKRGYEKAQRELGSGPAHPPTEGLPTFGGTLAGLNKDNAKKFGTDAAVSGYYRRKGQSA